ncbi:MAG: kelch repeat-containing protein [bacterium]
MKKNIRFYSMYSTFMSIIIMLFATGFVGTASICLAQGGTWTRKADIPSPRWFLSSCAVNGRIYAIGGVGGYINVEEYNPGSNTWTTKAPMPTGRGFLATSAINGKIYAFGGTNRCCPKGTVFATTQEYDPATGTWTTKADMPTARYGVCAGVIDEKIYVIAGDPPVKKVEMYDPVTDTWTPKQDMPTARWAPTCGVVNGKIYVFGGLLRQGGPATKVVEMYDPATDTWTPKAGMPEARVGQATAVINGQIFIFGGTNYGGRPAHSNQWRYDPTTDTWDTSLPNMPFNWFVMGYSVVNERVYLMAGSSAPYPHGDQLRRVYEYDPLVTSVEDNLAAGLTTFALHQNYPNPFNPETTIQYQTPERSEVKLVIFSLLGQRVATLVDAVQSMGIYSVQWNGKDDTGKAVASGVYLYRLQTKQFVQVKKLALLR